MDREIPTAETDEVLAGADGVGEVASPVYTVADIVDPSPKADLASLEHPMFALRAGERRVREYQHGEVTVQVRPGQDGIATIHDRDVWIYAISQLVEAQNRGREIGRNVRFTAYDFLVVTNRGTSGRSYERMAAALRRLSETRIETNLETGGRRERAGFGLIDSWRVVERGEDGRMVAVEITLPDWLCRSIQARQVLTLHRDYFGLRRPLERRLYELARKHCGGQPRWLVSIRSSTEKRAVPRSSSAFGMRCARSSRRILAGVPIAIRRGYGRRHCVPA